jgi:hypothetical protein
MSAPYFKPRSPKYLLLKAKADLEAMTHAWTHAREMENRVYCDTPKDVVNNISAYFDAARALQGALHKWVQTLERDSGSVS